MFHYITVSCFKFCTDVYTCIYSAYTYLYAVTCILNLTVICHFLFTVMCAKSTKVPWTYFIFILNITILYRDFFISSADNISELEQSHVHVVLL